MGYYMTALPLLGLKFGWALTAWEEVSNPNFSDFRSQIPVSSRLRFPLSCSSQIDIHASGCSGAPRGPDLTTSWWMWVLPVVELKGP